MRDDDNDLQAPEHEWPATTILTAAIRQVVKIRCEEHARLKRQIRALETRVTAIATEVDGLLAEAGLGEALLEGVTLDGHRLKLVAGESSKLNIEKLVRLGCDPQWIADATTKVPKQTYIKFTHPAVEDEG